MEKWADKILRLSPAEKASTAFGPFFVDPESGRLMLLNELRRGPRRDCAGFPIAPSRGWVNLDFGVMIWCALGAEEILTGRTLPARVVSPVGGKIDLNYPMILDLVSSGRGFVFCGDLFLLPKERYLMNSFTCNLAAEPLDVFVGYRGHTQRYPEILTPSFCRKCNSPSPDAVRRYMRRVTYAGNIVKQTFWEQQAVALDNVRANGILQHHGTVGQTDILDLTYDLNVAKWFALNRFDPTSRRYVPKAFNRHLKTEDMLDEASYVYTVIVRGLGATKDPFPVNIKGVDIRLLAWNLNPLWSTRPEAQRGFGVWGLSGEDSDKFGAVLSVVERRYHPYGAEAGWDDVGGPSLTVDGHTYSALDDSSALQDLFFPPEEPWLANALALAKGRIAEL